MLGNGMERLYKVQPYHFPGIVADISLESLSSPSAEDNIRFNNTQQSTTLSPLINENHLNDINKNINTDSLKNSLAQSCDNKATFGEVDVETNANHLHSSSSSPGFSYHVENQIDVGQNIKNSGNIIALQSSYTTDVYFDRFKQAKLSPEEKKQESIINCNSLHADNGNSNCESLALGDSVIKGTSNEEVQEKFDRHFEIKEKRLVEKVDKVGNNCRREPEQQFDNNNVSDETHDSSDKVNDKSYINNDTKSQGDLVHTTNEFSDISSSIISKDSESVLTKFNSEPHNAGIKSEKVQQYYDSEIETAQEVNALERTLFVGNNVYKAIIVKQEANLYEPDNNLIITHNKNSCEPSSQQQINSNEQIDSVSEEAGSPENHFYPIVNIRTLGDGTDGSYEINIQNLYPTSLSSDYVEEDLEPQILTQSKCYPNVINNRESLCRQSKCNSLVKSINDRKFVPSCSPTSNEELPKQKDTIVNRNISNEYVKHWNKKSSEDVKYKDGEKQTLERIDYINVTAAAKDQVTVAADSPSKDLHCNEQYVGQYNCNTSVTNDGVKVGSNKSSVLMRSQSDESHQRTQSPESLSNEERNRESPSSAPEVQEIHRRRKRRPRKLPEIPKQQYQQRKELHLSLPLNLNGSNHLSLSTVVKPIEKVLSLADELQQAMCFSGEASQSDEANNSESSNQEFRNSHHVLSYSSNKNDFNKDSSNSRPNLLGVKSIISLDELGSPEHVEPPSFRDSGFFGDFDYNAEILKQEVQIQQQQQVLLRQIYKDRNRKSYASDCDSGYTTQDAECHSRPSSTGPVLCCRCGSSASQTEENDTLVHQQQSPVDYYIDDDVQQQNGSVGRKRDVKLEYTIKKQHTYEAQLRNFGKENVEYEEKKQTEQKQTEAEETIPPRFHLGEEEDDMMITHRCCHKFVPRHDDQLFIEIGDPIFVEKEEDDLWCDGVNLRTKKKGIFPSVCATDLNFLEGEGDGTYRPVRFYLRLLGSVQVNYYKGTQVLTQAIQKVAMSRRMTMTSNPPNMCCLEITDYGIRLTDKKTRKMSSSSKMPRSLSQILGQKSVASEESNPQQQEFNHFYSLKNVTFCGYHQTNQKYFAFITKHPLEMKFACHVLLAEESTACISEAIGASFKRYYQQYLAATHPTEDIYLEN